MQLDNKRVNFQNNYLHEYVLLVFMWAFCVIAFICQIALFNPPSFAFQVPFFSTFFLLACPAVGYGLIGIDIVNKKREQLLLILSCLFCAYLAYGTYQHEFDVILVRVFWIFVAMSGSYFLSYNYVTYLLAMAYVSMGLVHLALPSKFIGYPVWMYMVLVPLLMLGFFYMVSQSIFNHRRLQESERNLLLKTKEQINILDSLNAMVAYKDKSNTYLSVNQAMADFFGKTKEEIVGRSLNELIDPELAERYFIEDQKIIESGVPMRDVVDEVPSPDGTSALWLKTSKIPFYNEDSEIAGIVFSAEDVTEQVLAEHKLKESEERFRMIFEKAPDGMGLISISNNTFVKVNMALAKMAGMTEEELIGKSPTEIAHPDDRFLSLSLFNEAVKNDLSEYAADQRILQRNGTIIVCRLSAHIVRESGRPKYLICLFQDITKKRENEQQLQKYATQLEESNQNLQEFAYAASHDLREPLRTVVSYVQLLKKYLGHEGQKPEIYEFMDYIVSGSRRMEKQITALLQYSRVGRGELTKGEVDMNYSLDVVKASLYAQIKENDAIITNDDLPTVFAEQSQIEAVLQNLISNSLKYQRRGVRPIIHISSFHKKDNIVISISDNGIGIEAEQMEKVFAVFRRLHTQDEYPGSGVGLAICRRIVKRHGGQIWLESEPGEGSTFYFSIPMVKSVVKKKSVKETVAAN